MRAISIFKRIGLSAVVALGVATAPALAQHATHPSPREKHAIEHAVSSLFRALRNRDYRLACNLYTPRDRHEFVVVAKLLPRPPAIADCAHAFAAIEKKAPPGSLKSIGAPQFKRITIFGDSAHVTITDTRQGHQTTPATLTLVHGPHGWKVELEVTIEKHPISPS